MVRLVLMSVLLLGVGCAKKTPQPAATAEQPSNGAHPSIPAALAEKMQKCISLLEQGEYFQFIELVAAPKELEKVMKQRKATMAEMVAMFRPKASSTLEVLRTVIQTEVRLRGKDAEFEVNFASDQSMPPVMVWSNVEGEWYLR